ncbi:Syntaxin-binding protein 6 [Triplophysa tibetana]|uniref:Syntaxin-binding protein 6 n=1 Tax=Triplophysa tibetana TaxID=1572043 RepID=A0A5A9NPW9_9TELE|nr:Syntaxin-binding protein 6 [Triplophysa tibetana]
MSGKLALNKEVFIPNDERMLAAAQVKRRTKKKIPFLATGGQGDYTTFICLSVTNKKPIQVNITKVKQFQGLSSFVRRSQWSIIQLREVNAVDSTRVSTYILLRIVSTVSVRYPLLMFSLVINTMQDCPEFDLTFENGTDQWTASSAGEKSMFIQILNHTCQRYMSEGKPHFINCHPKVMGGGNSLLHNAADSVSSAVQKASQALNERGEKLGRVEEKTGEMMNSAQHFADTAHKVKQIHIFELILKSQRSDGMIDSRSPSNEVMRITVETHKEENR